MCFDKQIAQRLGDGPGVNGRLIMQILAVVGPGGVDHGPKGVEVQFQENLSSEFGGQLFNGAVSFLSHVGERTSSKPFDAVRNVFDLEYGRE